MTGITTWNPHVSAGRALGLEWFPTTVDSVTLDNENDVLVTSIVCTETKSISELVFHTPAGEVGTVVAIDVYEDQLPSNTAQAVDTYPPAPTPNIACLRWGFVNDELVAPVDGVGSTEIRDNNPITYHYNKNALHYADRNFETWTCAFSAGLWTTRRPLYTQVIAQVDNVTDDAAAQPLTFEPLIFPNTRLSDRTGPYGTEYALQSRVQVFNGWNKVVVQPRRGTDNTSSSGGPAGTTLDSGLIYSDPYANAPWTVEALLREINGPTDPNHIDPNSYVNSWGVRCYASYAPKKAARIIDLSIKVGYVSVDTRVATGTVGIGLLSYIPGFQIMIVGGPFGSSGGGVGGPFTMTAGKTYFFVMRIVRDIISGTIGSATIGRLADSSISTQIRGGYGSTILTADNPYGLVSGFTDGIPSTAVAVMGPANNSGLSNDSVTYRELQYIPVMSSNSIQQEWTPTANMTLRTVKFIVARERAVTPTADLTVALRLRSNGSLIQQTTVPLADLAEPRTSGQVMTAMFATNANLVANTQYYIEFTSPTRGWTVGLLNANDLHTLGVDSPTAGGTNNRASWLGGDIGGDVAVALYQTPAAPSGFALTEVVTSVPPASTALHGIRVSWSATSLGAQFDHYEVERYDDEEGFVRIANITTESATAVNDWEHRLGVAVFYRMRVVNDLGIPSPWDGPLNLTVSLTDCGYFFTSNEDPTLNVAGIDTNDGKREWGGVLETEIVPMYGREGSIGFQELERRGDTFELDLLLYNGGTTSPPRLVPDPGGRAAFGPWFNLARARVSYICARNEKGDRWYSSIDHVDVRIDNDVLYYAKLSVQQTTWTPSPVDEP
jgi:hypothetical protein